MRLFALVMLMMFSIGAEAKIDVQIANDGKFDGGTIKYIEQTKPDEKGFVTVTITVTPDKEKGYTISKNDITVVSTYPPSSPNSGTRTPEIADNLTLYFKGSADADIDDPTAKRDYTFIVPTGFGAWVKEAKFQEKKREDGSKGVIIGEKDDYSGIYYIGAVTYDANNSSNNFYLCPTEEWYYYDSENNTYTNTPNGNPFLTTYKCQGTDGYVASKGIWYVEKHPTLDYYYIKHASDNKYLTYNDAYFSNIGRVRVHLEDLPTDNYALFAINYDSSKKCHEIISKKASETVSDGGRIYLNVNKGNKQNLKGDGDAFNSVNTGGIIGLWTAGAAESTGSGRFYLEYALSIDPPAITNNNNGTFTITAATGATIYYTTNGDRPTTFTTTTGTTSVNVSQTESMTVIKAISKAASDPFPTVVTTYNIPTCEKPVITVSGGNVTITCATEGAAIHYTTDGNPATANSTTYAGPFAKGDASTIRAIATKAGYVNSSEATLMPPTEISSSSQIIDMGGNYILADNFSSSGSIGTADNPFTGTIDGKMVTLSGLSHPFVGYANGAIIKNVILDNVTISGNNNGNAGAICGEATGDTRIYNCGVLATNSTVTTNKDGYTEITSCSSTISGSGYVGGIVGLLDGSSRVINCFSYANITAGNYVGGIVGYNNVATTSANLKTMVMNCMFYGDIDYTATTSRAPIYNGKIITNISGASGVSNFNYFLSEASYVQNQKITNGAYNCALSAETRYLQRFEFFRHLLNSNRELAAWWATGSRENKDEMMKWVMEPSQIGTTTPYPILKTFDKYSSVVNFDADNAPTATVHNKGGKLTSIGTNGELSVTISEDATMKAGVSRTFNLVITDKDPDHFNFNYGKVQLPYYNDYCTGNYTGNKVVTGWEVTVTGGIHVFDNSSEDASLKTISADGDIELNTPYNFADRKSTQKDNYSTNGNRVFNQGAYFDVPEGVTSIIIKPHWANCVFVADEYMDVVYDKDMGTPANVATVGGGKRYASGTLNINGTESPVYTSMDAALTALNPSSTSTVYDNAIVLVGNVHNIGITYTSADKPFTIMSIDLDEDNEPDYSYILRFKIRNSVHPVRIDFLNVIGLGMAQKSTGGTGTYNFGIMNPLDWFEVTNTALFQVTQFEYEHKNRNAKPIILHGGVIEQWVSAQSNGNGNKTNYIHVGGNVWFKEFHLGWHQDSPKSTKHPPVSVTGGDFDNFYLTGFYASTAANYDDNAECYINGGRFGKVSGTGMEGIGNASTHANGNIIWQIDNADIDEFYAGGINAALIAEGNIYTVISNSRVDQFCGGPKFGDMNSGKVVVTNATNCTFRTFFGAGYGGNSYNRYYPTNKSGLTSDPDWNSWIDSEYNNDYNETYKGVSTRIDYQYIPMSDNQTSVARLFVDFVRFSLATTHDVTTKLTGCTITKSKLGRLDVSDDDKRLGNFYGGGSLGKVTHDVKSTLTNCTIDGNVYGAGYSATLPKVSVMKDKFPEGKQPKYDKDLGAYLEAELPETDFVYRWEHRDVVNSTETAIDKGEHILYTTEKLTELGKVTGNVTLNIDGSTTVGESVYGGGEESAVDGNTYVTVNSGEIGVQNTGKFGYRWGNVYGGGKGKITIKEDGSSELTVSSIDDLDAGLVKGNTNVTINGTTETTNILHNVYGGGAVGSVGTFTRDANGMPTACEANTGLASVTINGGTIGHNHADTGMVDGSSRGWEGNPNGMGAFAFLNQLAWVNNTNVTIGSSTSSSEDNGPTIFGSVYGGGENGHNFNNGVVTVNKGTVGYDQGSWDCGNIYGAGCGTDTFWRDDNGNGEVDEGENGHHNPMAGLVRGTTSITINGGNVLRNVYGGGSMGSVGTYTYDANGLPTECATGTGSTTININGGTIGKTDTDFGHVFGGPKGNLSETEYSASVGETQVNINTGADVKGSVFGGGEAGIVKGNVAVNMKGGQVNKDVYGGGALAHTQTSNWDATGGTWTDAERKSTLYTTTVRLTGGTILGEAYGGALGEKEGVNGATSDIEAFVYGDVLLDLNGTTPIDDTTHKPSTTGSASANTSKGCVVSQIFGCNNVNGSPKGDVMVHVYGTQNKLTTTIGQKFIREKDSDTAKGENEGDAAYVTRLQGILAGKIALAEALSITVTQANKDLCTAENPAVTDLTTAITGITTSINAKTTDEISGVRYDMGAVYGGGNMAAYVPVTPYKPTEAPTGSKTQVIIEGCSLTSIETVYGGGNAAAVPETNVDIKGAYEIGYLFGGGNGKDDLPNGDRNPGADIGQYNNGTEMVTYGTGNANSLMEAGVIHEAYGGSNTKGVLKGSINQTTAPKKPTDPDYCCDLVVDKIVGAGKYADIDGDVNMTLSCQPSTKVPLLFAGADEANVNGNITLNITNGNFGQVFGGNNLGGAVKGKITVNVKETDCQPIKIDELYLGGNEAAYSVYGYYESEEEHPVTKLKILKPRESADDGHTPVPNPTPDATHTFPYAQPELNIISCTYIGKVFGGGLGAPAKMYANPTVNVNMEPGEWADTAVPAMMTELGLDVTKTAPNPDKLGIIGDVFGGGNAADIEGNTRVNIATVEGKSAYIVGSVYGGGNAADVLGNTNVTMSDGYVFNGIFGGGYAGNVGTFTRSTAAADVNVFGHTADDSAHEGECIGKPISCKEGTGLCTVVVDGGQIGPISVATQGMNRPEAQGGPVPQGWVWGGGQGLVEDPAKHPDTHFSSYVGSTDVTIGGTALIMESIIGGGEFGRVLGNTLVKIEGGQIGVGAGKVDANNKPIRYTDDQFVNPLTTTITNDDALAECSHFPYGRNAGTTANPNWVYEPYDPYYDDNKTYADAHDLGPASTSDPSDGKTWIGCVFAGGSGYMPYLKKDNNGNPVGYDWCSSAGLVEGDTEVRISGGHILTNVYGGNEYTNVKGKCKVTMTGGTIGVPRTVEQIIAHPLTCYLFGAGKGDPRPHFNTETNVGEVEINISGGIIYGSVFGGGEDGHVQRDVKLTIGKDDHTGPVIGTWGTTYVDGNIFGGGRGFAGDAYTAGNVAGSVDLKIKGGTMLGSIYGGGRLGSVGYGLYPPSAGDTYYGAMRPDNTGDDANNTAIANFKRGYVDVEISGGTIGNSYEYIIPSAANTPTGLSFDGIATWTDANWTTWKTHNNIPLTEFDKATYRLKHTKGGNVFTGGMGRLYQLDGVTPITAVNWWKVGCVKQTKLTVKGGTIKSNVYGGGELGAVKPYVNGTVVQGGKTEVIVQNENNTQIGTEVMDGSNATQYTFGSVYGGGYGSTIEYLGTSDDTSTENDNPKFVAGLVHGDTEIDMQGGKVLASVYGGGEVASVNGSADVKVSGGEVGKDKVGDKQFGGPTMGNVYGGGSGHPNIVRCGRILKNTKVTISGTDTKIYHNVYGGGAYGTVGDFEYTTGDDGKVIGIIKRRENTTGGNAEVTITGGSIGVDGHENGMVFGSSRGDVNKPGERDDHTAWVYNTFVTIGTSGVAAGPNIKGSVYGSGENGHTFNDAVVNIHSGTIGITDTSIDGGARYAYRGNVYGGGCGTDTYTGTDGEYYNNLAGIVYGTATVNMDGGHVVHNVYGAGAMGSVGKFAFDANDKPTDLENDAPENSGKCYINISGGQIGMTGMQMTATGGPDDYGHVFGAGRGELQDPADYPNLEVSGYVNNTNVEISGTAFVTGSVYGGGENGHVLGNTSVTVSGGQIGCGDGETGPYTSGWDGTSMKECASWPYTDNGATYDMYAGTPNYNSEGGSKEATDGHTFYGNVFGGGSGYTPYAAGKWMRSAGRVEGNTSVTITDGHILTNVYGGNEQTDVGNGLSLEAGKGKCTITMTGGTVGVPRTHSERLAHPVTGNLFGAGKGDKRVLFNRWTNVGSTEVSVSGGTVYGSVFGGGEDGHVLGNAKTTISGTSTVIGTLGTTGSDGNVFGGGRGSVTALTAGVVCGDVSLDILGGMIKGSVYGGGRLASLGTYLVAVGDSRYGKQIPEGKNLVIDGDDVETSGATHGHVTINISGGTIGALDGEGKVKVSANSIGDVYGGCKGTTEGTLHDVLGVSTNATINLLGGTVGNAIYGGGEVGNVGELGEGDDSKWAFAKVNLLGGSVKNVYGGGLGKKNVSQNIDSKAFVKGDVTVNLNGLETGDYDSNIHTMVEGIDEDGADGVDFYRLPVANRNSGCKVLGNIFGCNNVNGTPTGHSKVHVFMTTPKAGQLETEYDISAIYGGGNQADYDPTDAIQSTEVIIEGCDLTKIQQVYGGGNAAASPGTSVLIKGTQLIDEVFGGGNGVSTETFENPGANVGYHTNKDAYTSGDGKANVQLMAGTINNVYGGSNSNGDIRGGSVITKPTPVWREGNGVNASCCQELSVDQIFGGGKNADMRSGAEIVLGCMPSDWIGEIYAGAEMANVKGDVSLTLTSGKFGRVFGGNKTSGILDGSITVNIDENGDCDVPIVIGELYGGGNMAAYSIYGYEGDEPRTKAQYDALTAEQKAAIGLEKPHASPVVNVHGFTSIGNIFGGGYGVDADMYGSPTVNINEVLVSGNKAYQFANDNSANKPTTLIDGVNVKLYDHVVGNMGVINNVFGGGNAALVDGNTTVNIATEEKVYVVKLVDVGNPVNGLYKRVKNETTGEVTYTIQDTNDKAVEGSNYYQLLSVQGADIRGNVYGGGNQAEVTGDTNVVIGRKDASTSTSPARASEPPSESQPVTP